MKRRNFLSYCATAAAAAYGQRPIFGADNNVRLPSADTVHVGGSKRIDIGGGHWVWTKKIGSGEIKVLLLHGGPGADHRYFEGFEDFLPLNGIEFYYYDQLDSTNSEKPDDPALWTIEPQRPRPTPILSAGAFVGRTAGHRIWPEIPTALKGVGDFQYGGKY